MIRLHERVVSTIEQYVIERELGRGATSTVYLARDSKHDRLVALKLLRPEVTASLGADRFLREIRLLAGLQHPHILPLYDSGEVDGALYYVMAYVEGESLRDRLKREGRLPVGDAVTIAREVAGALGYAHMHNVVHRDIKPENILLASGEPMLADFGIARAISRASGEYRRTTDAGIVLGTPAYMSPEQASAEPVIDGRTDIYALGCVLYEMLAGVPPFTGPTPQAVIARRFLETPPRIDAVRADVSPGLEQVVRRALAPAPGERYQSAQEMESALENAASGAPLSLAQPAEGAPRWLWLAAAAAVLAGAAVVFR